MIMKKKLLNNKVSIYFDLKNQAKLVYSALMVLCLFCFSNQLHSQTTLINPATDGGFNSGSTFAANGWTVANEGAGIVKWEVGSAINAGAINGNSAYISLDGGATNTSAGAGLARTMFFYRDVTLPAGQTNIALTFDWKSADAGWQVFVAPTSYTPVGSDAQTSFSGFPSVANIAGITPVVFSAPTTVTSGKATGFIPGSFAGTTVRLVFMWTNSTSGGTNPPLAIDNISLVSRVGGQELISTKTGDFSDPTVWDAGYVPSPSDDAVILGGHTVTIDNKNLGVDNLFVAGANAIVNFAVNTDLFTIATDLQISGSGARMNVWNGTAGRALRVGRNIDLSSGGRLDVSVGNTGTGFGLLDLNGSTVQTISSDGTGILGGTNTTITTANTSGVINQLDITNTSTATANIVWNINNVRIKSALRLNKARVNLGSNKIILGNFTTLSNIVAPFGNGFIGGTVARWYGTGATGAAINPGADYNNAPSLFPILGSNGENRFAYLVSTTGATAQGELEVTYTSSATLTTGLSIVDGAYTVTNRYDGSWTINNAGSGGSIYTNATGTFTLGLYATGAYEANDGLSRIVNASTIVTGEHVNGTTTPFVVRKGISLTNLKAGAIYVGFNAASALGTTTVTSITSGDWNSPSTWSTNAIPTCSDVVKIATGHIVTNNASGNASGLTIEFGGALIMASNTLTIGCTNNNAIVSNYGTLTVSGGTLAVNGAVTHKNGSSFNQSNGVILVDSNANGVQANSIGIGGSSFKIDNASLNLQGGEIVIVDPLINNSVATTAISTSGYTIPTYGATGTFTKATNAAATTGASMIVMNGFNSNQAIYGVGQVVTGTGIAPGTTVTSVAAVNFTSNSPINIGLSLPITADIASGASITFSSMSNGCTTINFPTGGNFDNIAIGQIVSGTGIPVGTTVVSFGGDLSGFAGVKLSNPVTGLTTSPIIEPETITFSAVSENCSTIILSAANPLITVGQAVGGLGIQPGTTVATISGVRLDLSLPTTSAITNPANLNFYDGNLGSYAFAYNSPNHYAAGLNHTLKIGNGISTEIAPVTTNGFLCNFQQGGGLFSVGNLTIDAKDEINRFFSVTGVLNVQNTLTINALSTFKKPASSGVIYLGGNVINNGIGYMNTSQIKFMNSINGVEAATTIPQTISGTGLFYNATSVPAATASFSSLVVNNTSAGGITIQLPNFRISGSITMNEGIIHTSSTTPLYHGLADLSGNPTISGNFSNTCFIDGPYWKDISSNSTNSNYQLFPVGKTSYKPISLAIAGGASITAEAFDTNSGTPSANVANLSATRWKATRNGTLGALTDFNVRLGDAAIASNNIIVQAATDQGTYDNVLGATTYATGTPNTLTTGSVILGTEFTGNFAYATAPNCSTVNPGNTLASLGSSTIIHTQRTALSGGIIAGNTTVTLDVAANPLIVPGLVVSGTGITPGSTVVSVAGTTLNLSLPATVSSASRVTLTFTLVQAPTSLYTTQPVLLSLQNNADGNGVTYQWQSSPDGVNYTNIPGANLATYLANPSTSTYYLCVVTCPNGPVTANSTPYFVEFLSGTPTVTGGTGCANSPISLGATASSGTATWYASSTGGTPIATSTTYAPSQAATTTYYVSGESSYTVGRSFSGTLAQNANFSGLLFNTNRDVRLNSVKIHPKTAAVAEPITIKLFDSNGIQVPGTSAVTYTPTANTAALQVAIFDVVTLNYDIPAGSGYRLLITSGLTTTNTVGRISPSGDAPCPVGANSVSISGGITSLVATPTTSTYYNFFDMSFTESINAPRVPVTATVIDAPVINTISATCTEAGSSTITNYDSTLTYTFSPTGPSVTTGGVITSAVPGTEYTVSVVGCPTATATFTNAAIPTTNNVFFFVGMITQQGCTITITDTSDPTISYTINGTNIIGDYMFENIPFGTYNYEVKKDCFVTATGSVTVNCQPNGDGVGVSVGALTPQTTNNVFFFIGNLTTTPGCQVTITDTTDPTISYTINGTNIIGDYMFENIPFGTYSYEVRKNCFVTRTGTVTVNCQPNGEGVGVSIGALSAVNLDTSITRVGDTLTVAESGATYQWVDCDNSNAPISGQTSQSFTATTPGNYAVIVTTSNCTSTSACFSVATLENQDFTFTNFKYYPNPVSNQLTISGNEIITKVELFNLLGQMVKVVNSNSTEISVDFSELSTATYIIRAYSEQNVQTFKVIKKE